MFRRVASRMGFLALAGLGLLIVAGPAKAQQGWPYAGEHWGYYEESSEPSLVTPVSPNIESYQASNSTNSYYDASTTVLPENRGARIILHVPGESKIWFDGKQTRQSGATRSFVSPPLAVGSNYVYEIRIQWKQDGKDITQTRAVRVHAGDLVNLTLGLPEPAQSR